MYENKMAEHRKSCLGQKLLQIGVVSVANGYTATIQMSISIIGVQHRVVNLYRLLVSPVRILTDRLTDKTNCLTSAHTARGNKLCEAVGTVGNLNTCMTSIASYCYTWHTTAGGLMDL